MSDVPGVDPGGAPQRLLEGQHDGHPGDQATKLPRTARAPRPDLRGSVPDHGNAGRVEFGRKQGIEFGVVDQERCARTAQACGAGHETPRVRDLQSALRNLAEAKGSRTAQIGDQVHPDAGQRRTPEPEHVHASKPRNGACRGPIARSLACHDEQTLHATSSALRNARTIASPSRRMRNSPIPRTHATSSTVCTSA